MSAKGQFEERVTLLLAKDSDLHDFIRPMLRAREALRAETSVLDKLLKTLVQRNEICKRLMSIPGIGPINALAFVTTIDNPHNFKNSRSVGAVSWINASKICFWVILIGTAQLQNAVTA